MSQRGVHPLRLARRRLLSTLLVVPVLAACVPGAAPTPTPAPSAVTPAPRPAAGQPGSPENPLRMAFVPSVDSQRVLAAGRPLADLLEQVTGYRFEVSVPTSYVAVIEALGAGKADIAWLAPFAYVLAHDRYRVEVILTTVRQGSRTYRSQFIAHVDAGIQRLEDLRGKRFAFADPASASGFLYPAATLKEKGYDYQTFFREVVFAGGHDKVVIAVYNRQVDGGATFGRSSEDPNAPPTDARVRLQSTLPDVLQKVRVIAETDPIPNDTVSVRQGLPPAVVERVRTGLLELAQTGRGKEVLRQLYQIDGLAEARDSDYDGLRRKAQILGFSFEQALQPAPTPVATPTPAARY